MNEYALFRLRITTLSPVHIGSGRELLNEYDYVLHGGRTWRINDAALLDAQPLDDPDLARRLAGIPPAQLLKEGDYQPGSPFFRYVIQGVTRATGEGAVLREQLKDVFDQPYLPGSSLKGALRTAVGWYAWEELGMRLETARLGRRRERAAQEYEREIFGRDPNHDLMRALQVSDSAPLGSDRLMVLNARVMNRGGSLGSPIELEALRPETEIETSLKLDLALFSEWARRGGLNLNGEQALRGLPEILNRRASERLNREANWFGGIPQATRLADFYRQLAGARLANNQVLLQVGWGSGWEDKTFGMRFQAQPGGALEGLIRDFRLSKGNRKPGDPFPRSRRAALFFVQEASGRRVEIPARPFGWLLATFEPLNGPAQGVWKSAPLARPAPPAAEKAAPAPAGGAVARPAPAPAAEAPQRKPVSSFSQPPSPGDRFMGVVLDCEPGGKILLQIPGLSVDDAAVAEVPAEANPGRRRFRDGSQLLVEVVRVNVEPGGYAVVTCERVES